MQVDNFISKFLGIFILFSGLVNIQMELLELQQQPASKKNFQNLLENVDIDILNECRQFFSFLFFLFLSIIIGFYFSLFIIKIAIDQLLNDDSSDDEKKKENSIINLNYYDEWTRDE